METTVFVFPKRTRYLSYGFKDFDYFVNRPFSKLLRDQIYDVISKFKLRILRKIFHQKYKIILK